jgi:hypothetical protein
MESTDPLRLQLQKLLDWQDAHVPFDTAIAGIPPELRGARPPEIPYSPWQLLEHLRRTQYDILDFCQNPNYVERKWPDDYWPETVAPPNAQAWADSVAAFTRDREALKRLCVESSIDLFAQIPHGDGQTYLREILLVADHNAYHVGELVLLRRHLGIWKTWQP